MAHGYLLAQLPLATGEPAHDEYGGSLENRLRFPLEVFDAVRAVWPEERAARRRPQRDDCAPAA